MNNNVFNDKPSNQPRQVPPPILKNKSQTYPTPKKQNSNYSSSEESPQFEVDIIIAEKPRISGAIARSLVKSGTIEEYLHTDIIIIDDSQQNSEGKKYRLPIYLQQDIDQGFYFEVLHLDEEGKKHAEKIRRRRSADQALEHKVIEEISYYILPYENKIIIICDTQGNPLTYDLPNYRGQFHNRLLNLISSSKNWFDLSKELILKASFKKRQINSQDDKTKHSKKSESYVARTSWFEYVLGRRKLPCTYKEFDKKSPYYSPGTQFKIGKVIAATDEDIAGRKCTGKR